MTWKCCREPYKCCSGYDFCPGHPPFTKEERYAQDIEYLSDTDGHLRMPTIWSKAILWLQIVRFRYQKDNKP